MQPDRLLSLIFSHSSYPEPSLKVKQLEEKVGKLRERIQILEQILEESQQLDVRTLSDEKLFEQVQRRPLFNRFLKSLLGNNQELDELKRAELALLSHEEKLKAYLQDFKARWNVAISLESELDFKDQSSSLSGRIQGLSLKVSTDLDALFIQLDEAFKTYRKEYREICLQNETLVNQIEELKKKEPMVSVPKTTPLPLIASSQIQEKGKEPFDKSEIDALENKIHILKLLKQGFEKKCEELIELINRINEERTRERALFESYMQEREEIHKNVRDALKVEQGEKEALKAKFQSVTDHMQESIQDLTQRKERFLKQLIDLSKENELLKLELNNLKESSLHYAKDRKDLDVMVSFIQSLDPSIQLSFKQYYEARIK